MALNIPEDKQRITISHAISVSSRDFYTVQVPPALRLFQSVFRAALVSLDSSKEKSVKLYSKQWRELSSEKIKKNLLFLLWKTKSILIAWWQNAITIKAWGIAKSFKQLPYKG